MPGVQASIRDSNPKEWICFKSLRNWKDFRKRMAKSDGNRSNMSVKVFRQALLRWLLTLLSVSSPNEVAILLPNNYSSGDMPKEEFRPKEYLSPTNSQWFSSSWNHKVTRRGFWGSHPLNAHAFYQLISLSCKALHQCQSTLPCWE